MNTSQTLRVYEDDLHEAQFINIIGTRREGANPVFTIRGGIDETEETTFDVDLNLKQMESLKRMIDHAIFSALNERK